MGRARGHGRRGQLDARKPHRRGRRHSHNPVHQLRHHEPHAAHRRLARGRAHRRPRVAADDGAGRLPARAARNLSDDVGPIARPAAPDRAAGDTRGPDHPLAARAAGGGEMMPGHIVRFAIAIIAFAILARLPVGLDPAFQFDAALAIIWGFGILSLVLLTGYARQVSLCQATFAGVAAYGAGMTVASMHCGYLLGIVISVLAATVVGVIVGLPALRLHGITLAIVTLGIALVFDKYVFQDHIFDWFTGGTGGLHVTPGRHLRPPVGPATHLLTPHHPMLAPFC